MQSTKCRKCGLVNFASAQACKRCEAPLQVPGASSSSNQESAWQDNQENAGQSSAIAERILLKPETFNGIGVDLRNYKQLSPDTYQVTRCFTVLWVPLIPINTWIIRPLSFESGALRLSESHNYELLAQKPLDINSILRLYGGFLFWIALAFAPFALTLYYLSIHKYDGMDGMGSKPGLLPLILFLFSMPWSIGLILWLKGRRDKIYAQAKKAVAVGSRQWAVS